ncbi:hypothetical protein GCM10022214_38090 [Actinomadura miaoliensis]|uniref:Uncharacterized protein n=1 Tax=Actinomadura miaoliensis TaxID=430685 RepID=A0ABP7VY67_9ACTN
MEIRSVDHGELFADDIERAVNRPRDSHGGGGDTARPLYEAVGRRQAADPAGRD